VSVAILALSARALLRGWRALVIAGLALIPVAVAVGQRVAGEAEPEDAYADLLGGLLIPTVTAFVALILAASAISDDRDDGTILQLVATTVSRTGIVAAKVLAAWASAMLALVPALIACAIVALGTEVTPAALLWPVAAVAATGLAYSGAFVWIALRTRRAIAVGAAYVLLWEGTLATFADGVDRLSVAAYGRAVAAEGVRGVDAPPVGAAVAALVLLAIAAAGVWLGTRALSRVELP